MSDLPADRERALDVIAGGWGRTPTTAHPLCICGKWHLPRCDFCGARTNRPCRPMYDKDLTCTDVHHPRRPQQARPKDCRLHRPPPRRQAQPVTAVTAPMEVLCPLHQAWHAPPECSP